MGAGKWLEDSRLAMQRLAFGVRKGRDHWPEALDASVDDGGDYVQVRVLVRPLAQITAGGLLTHFALRLDRADGTPWLLERTSAGVIYEPLDEQVFAARCEEYEEVAADPERCELSPAEVESFVVQQRTRPYHSVTRNCKHLAFDFFVDVVKDRRRWSAGWNWTWFCQEYEGAFRNHQRSLRA